MDNKTLIEKLVKIQAELKAPKNQRNTFGNYNYRNCEDILEAVKPLLLREGLVLIISDDIHKVEYSAAIPRTYVKSTVTLTDGENSISNTAFARESETKKGMDDSQITGSTSSYARKYALNGMFLIDDTKDADATNTHGKEETKTTASGSTNKNTPSTKETKQEDKPVSRFAPKNKPKDEPKEDALGAEWV